jgi:hypothetical protein
MTRVPRQHWRVFLLGLITLATLVVTGSLEPIPQDPRYHHFVDTRSLWGIPNAWNILSNLPFILVGAIGIAAFRTKQSGNAQASWRVFFICVTLVAVGSGYYHWAPANDTLVWDRLAMAAGFMAFLVALLAKIYGNGCERYLLAPMILLGLGSVVYWAITDDLRWYAWVQFFPILLILILALLYRNSSITWRYPFIALGFYVAAKAAEFLDQPIYELSNYFIAGHALKHLLAAMGAYALVKMYQNP